MAEDKPETVVPIYTTVTTSMYSMGIPPTVSEAEMRAAEQCLAGAFSKALSDEADKIFYPMGKGPVIDVMPERPALPAPKKAEENG